MIVKDKVEYERAILKLKSAGMLREAKELEELVLKLYKSYENLKEEMREGDLLNLENERRENLKEEEEIIAINTTLFDL